MLKWVGGKTKLLPELVARMPSTYGTYYEPFCGGAALFFHVAPARAVISDANADLIATYRAVADDVEAVIAELELLQAGHDPAGALYYAIRGLWNDGAWLDEPTKRAAAFIYLNRTCFNGLWRVNSAGALNSPLGAYTKPRICAPDELRAAGWLLRRAQVRCGDYRASVAHAERGDFVYFDPPYVPVSSSANFTAYTAEGFGERDQRELAATARGLDECGVYVMASNSDTPLVRQLWRGFQIDRVKCPRAINSDGAKRGDVDEVIITGRVAARARRKARVARAPDVPGVLLGPD